MERDKQFMTFLLIALSLIVSMLSMGCANNEQTPLEEVEQEPDDMISRPVDYDIKDLASVEVREYNGKRLSSLTKFRDNSIAGPQYVDMDEYRLEISGLVDRPGMLSYDEVLDRQRYQKVVTLNCVEGWSATILWEGILLSDLLSEVGVQEKANTVIFYAEDGYSTTHTLDYILNNNILMAYRMNNVTLLPEMGFPFQLVAEDKWGYKWIKWITKIELGDDPEVRGYWEQRGYNHDGNLSGPKREI